MNKKENKDKKTSKKKENIKEMEGKYLRALADYQNLLKQTAKEKLDFVKYANEGLLRDIIPVYDHLKISLQHTESDNEWLVGIKHVIKQFKEVLFSAGVKEIETKNKEFNPMLMDALQQEETSDIKQDNYIYKEIRPGYTLHEKVIIPAQVAVYKYNNSQDKKNNK